MAQSPSNAVHERSKCIAPGRFAQEIRAGLYSGRAVVLKRCSKVSPHEELELLQRVRHPSIVSPLCLHGRNTLVLPWIAHISLQQAIEHEQPEIRWQRNGLRIALQLAHALSFLHSSCKPAVALLDLEPADILLHSFQHITLVGFTSATLHAQCNNKSSSCDMPLSGTIYAAPELHIEPSERWTLSHTACDVFSFGGILLAIIDQQISPSLISSQAPNGCCTHVPSPMSPVEELYQLVSQCCSADPSSRPQMHPVVPTLEHLIFLHCYEEDTSAVEKDACSAEIPERFICPLSRQPIRDPVFINTGRTFERRWIMRHFQQVGLIDPITNEKLSTDALRPNLLLRSELYEWFQRRGRTNELFTHSGVFEDETCVLHPPACTGSAVRARRLAQSHPQQHLLEPKVNAILENSARRVRMVGHCVGPQGSEALAHAMRFQNRMFTLILRHNDIGDEGAVALSEALQHDTSIKTLDLGANRIGATGIAALLDAVTRNERLRLERVDLSGAIQSIHWFCKRYKALISTIRISPMPSLCVRVCTENSPNDWQKERLKLLKRYKRIRLLF